MGFSSRHSALFLCRAGNPPYCFIAKIRAFHKDNKQIGQKAMDGKPVHYETNVTTRLMLYNLFSRE